MPNSFSSDLSEQLERLQAGMEEIGAAGATDAAVHLEEKVKLAINVLSGNLRRSIAFKLLPLGSKLPGIRIGTIKRPPKYADIHEKGGTIHGRPWLTIPLRGTRAQTGGGQRFGPRISAGDRGSAFTKTGQSRFSAGQLRDKESAEAQGFPGGTFIRRSRAGNLIIFGVRGEDDLVPLFLLRRSVRIKPMNGKGYLRVTVLAELAKASQIAANRMERELILKTGAV